MMNRFHDDASMDRTESPSMSGTTGSCCAAVRVKSTQLSLQDDNDSRCGGCVNNDDTVHDASTLTKDCTIDSRLLSSPPTSVMDCIMNSTRNEKIIQSTSAICSNKTTTTRTAIDTTSEEEHEKIQHHQLNCKSDCVQQQLSNNQNQDTTTTDNSTLSLSLSPDVELNHVSYHHDDIENEPIIHGIHTNNNNPPQQEASVDAIRISIQSGGGEEHNTKDDCNSSTSSSSCVEEQQPPPHLMMNCYRSPYTYVPAVDSSFDRYYIQVDPRYDDRAVDILLYSTSRPHMRAFHLSWVSFLVAFFTWFAVTPLLFEIQRSIDLTKREVWISSVIAVSSSALTRCIIGPLNDTYGARWMMCVTLVASAIPTALAGWCIHDALSLYLIRFFIGIAGSSFVTCQYWTTTMFTTEIAGTANALAAGWGNLGGGLAQIIMGSILFPLTKYIYDRHLESIGSHDDDEITTTGEVTENQSNEFGKYHTRDEHSADLAWRTILGFPAMISFIMAYVCVKYGDDTPKGNVNRSRRKRANDVSVIQQQKEKHQKEEAENWCRKLSSNRNLMGIEQDQQKEMQHQSWQGMAPNVPKQGEPVNPYDRESNRYHTRMQDSHCCGSTIASIPSITYCDPIPVSFPTSTTTASKRLETSSRMEHVDHPLHNIMSWDESDDCHHTSCDKPIVYPESSSSPDPVSTSSPIVPQSPPLFEVIDNDHDVEVTESIRHQACIIRELLKESSSTHPGSGDSITSSVWRSIVQNFQRGAYHSNTWLLFIQYGCSFGVEITMTQVAAFYFHDRFGLRTESAASVASLFGWMNLFARGLGGYLSDSANSKAGLRGRLRCQFVLLILEGCSILVFACTNSLGGAILAMILFSILVQATEGSTFGLVPYVDSAVTGSVAGIVGAGGNVGGIIFAGLLVLFDYHISFYVMGIVVILSSLCTIFVAIPEHRGLFTGNDADVVVENRLLHGRPPGVIMFESSTPPTLPLLSTHPLPQQQQQPELGERTIGLNEDDDGYTDACESFPIP